MVTPAVLTIFRREAAWNPFSINSALAAVWINSSVLLSGSLNLSHAPFSVTMLYITVTQYSSSRSFCQENKINFIQIPKSCFNFPCTFIPFVAAKPDATDTEFAVTDSIRFHRLSRPVTNVLMQSCQEIIKSILWQSFYATLSSDEFNFYCGR